MKTYSRVYAKIDLDAIAYNMEQMKQNIRPETKVMAVIKADGYGHGAVQIAEMMERWNYIWGAQKGFKNRFWCLDVCSQISTWRC